jgi:hypothetical protein
MSQIKSFTISLPIDTIGFEQFTISKVENLSNKQFEALKVLASEYGQIEYEPEKPKILKRADGSVISGLEEGQEIVYINEQNYKVQEFIFTDVLPQSIYYKKRYKFSKDDIWQFRLSLGLIFLPEDTNLAEKKAKQHTKQREIQFEIDTLNAEEGWVPDWRDHNQDKYYLCVDYDEPDQYSCNCEQDYKDVIRIFKDSSQKRHNKYMSEKTAKTILAKYSQHELKQYLGIIL